MKKVKNTISKGKSKKIGIEDLAIMINDNCALKSDLKKVEENIKNDFKNELKNYPTKEDLKQELKKNATREETYAMEQRLIEVMAVNTNKILGAVESIVSRVQKIEEKVF